MEKAAMSYRRQNIMSPQALSCLGRMQQIVRVKIAMPGHTKCLLFKCGFASKFHLCLLSKVCRPMYLDLICHLIEFISNLHPPLRLSSIAKIDLLPIGKRHICLSSAAISKEGKAETDLNLPVYYPKLTNQISHFLLLGEGNQGCPSTWKCQKEKETKRKMLMDLGVFERGRDGIVLPRSMVDKLKLSSHH